MKKFVNIAVIAVIALGLLVIFRRRPATDAGAPTDSRPPAPPQTPIEQTAATVPPGTPIGMGGGVYEPPFKA